MSQECIPCSAGSYQPEEAQVHKNSQYHNFEKWSCMTNYHGCVLKDKASLQNSSCFSSKPIHVCDTDIHQDTCLVCPHGTFTAVETGATHQDQCKAQCRPGTWSQDGLDMCRTCDLGHYQSSYASIGCEKCPHEHWTLYRGSTSANDCKAFCPPGKISDTGKNENHLS